MRYRFNTGDRVRIRASKSASAGTKAHAGEIATIKRRCPFTWAYELVEFDGLWHDNCFEEVSV